MPCIMEIFVDGGCRRNGMPGAYGAAAACIRDKHGNYEYRTENLVRSPRPTNHRAEIAAMTLGLELVMEKYEGLRGKSWLDVTIYSDSRYAVNCMNRRIHRWSNNNWTNAAGREVTNFDLLFEAFNSDARVKEGGSLTYTWIPRDQNTIADQAANDAMDEQNRYEKYYFCNSSDSDY